MVKVYFKVQLSLLTNQLTATFSLHKLLCSLLVVSTQYVNNGHANKQLATTQ